MPVHEPRLNGLDMTLTTPTGQLLIDLALFSLFFLFAIGAVLVNSAREIKKGRRD
jgi:hypothetical protein